MLPRWLVVFLFQAAAARALMAASFDFQVVREAAQGLAERPFQQPTNAIPEALRNLSYPQYQAIQFHSERALWAGEKLPFTAEFFLPGGAHPNVVALHEVSGKGVQPVPFWPDAFTSEGKSLELPRDLGYAGFRLTALTNNFGEFAVFLGGTYFRMAGRGQTFGASARALALETVHLGSEEFPAFRQFWLRKPNPTDATATIWALMDSPSVAGAFEFVITPGNATVAQTRAALFPRRAVSEFGLAPVTSMFWYDENNHPAYGDYRPEVHDSDGLLMQTGEGLTLWRPLDQGRMMRVNAYQDRDPRGFGLMQRDRDFEQYQDLVARFEKRPSVWVEPIGKWGPGAVELVQLPTNLEHTDNVVAFWKPADPPQPGKPFELAYKIHWLTNEVSPASLGHVHATRVGAVPPLAQGQPPNVRFVIDFDGPAMQKLSARERLDAEVHHSPGTRLVADTVLKNQVNGTWRLVVEITAPQRAVDLQAVLKRRGEPVTETWTYTWQP